MPSSTDPIMIIKTGTANIAAVRVAFERLGREVIVTASAKDILEGVFVILPGVGSFGAAMAGLREADVIEAIQLRLQRDQPLLTICVGTQVLCAASEESPNAPGLRFLPNTVQRFRSVKGVSLRIPQLGWNYVNPAPSCRLIQPGYAYFANSYCITESESCDAIARSHYGHSFIAAIEHGKLLACQFHPELSGTWGRELLKRWLIQNKPGGIAC